MSVADKTVHLIDDRRMGGVTRFLERVSEMRSDDETRFVQRGTMRGQAHGAGTIVSHLAISWRTLPMMITLRACNPKSRIIHVEHSYCAGFETHRVPARKWHRFHTLLRTVYALFDEVVAVSEAQAGWMQELGVVTRRKIRVAPPLVNLDPFLAIPPVDVDSDALRYGYVGRLDEQKGLDAIILAWRDAASPDARLEIFGDGPLREMIQSLADGDKRITFHGATRNPAEAYEKFDIALMPSRWEPFGLSCLEARAAGRPVMVAPVDGLPEQLSGGGGWVMRGGLKEWVQAFAVGIDKAAIRDHANVGRQSAARQAKTARSRWASILDSKEESQKISPPVMQFSD